MLKRITTDRKTKDLKKNSVNMINKPHPQQPSKKTDRTIFQKIPIKDTIHSQEKYVFPP